MNRIIGTVLRKELRETLRDRRTLIIMIVVPVLLYPALLVITEQLALFGQRELERSPVAVALTGTAPGAVRFFERDSALRIVALAGEPIEVVKQGGADAVVRFPEGGWSASGTNEVQVLYDASRDRSSRARVLVEHRLRELQDSLLAGRLGEHGLAIALARPMAVSDESVATPQQMGGYTMGRFLPLILILMTILGAFYPAIDLAAGEKERGTLETLLATPAAKDAIVVGKFAAAALIAFIAASLNLLSMLLTFQAGVVQFARSADLRFDLPPQSILVIFGGLALLAVLFSALFLGIAIRSHSFKEAQNALTPIYIASFLPAMLPMMPGVQFTPAMALIPVGGVAFLFRELLAGDPPLVPSLLAVAATVVYTTLTLVFAARSFGREDVLFGGGSGDVASSSLRERLAAWRGAARQVPTHRAALGLIAALVLLQFYGARPLQIRLGETGILASQWLLLALPAALFVLLWRYDARQTLALRAPSARSLSAGLLIIAGGIPLGWMIAWLQGFVLPVPPEFIEAMQQLVTAQDAQRLLWLLLVVAVTPAVCEELVFRGALLQGLGSRLGAGGAIAGSALVFGAFHLSTETAIRFLPTAWLGLLLGYVVWHTRSLYVGMAMHLANNAMIVLLLSMPALRERFSDPHGQPPWLLVALAPLVLLAGLRLLPKRPAEGAPATGGSARPGRAEGREVEAAAHG